MREEYEFSKENFVEKKIFRNRSVIDNYILQSIFRFENKNLVLYKWGQIGDESKKLEAF